MIPKFRFFGKVDDRNERMVRADSIDFENGYIYYSYRQFTVEGDDHVYGDVIGFEDCVLMRSTGLFDTVCQDELFEDDVILWTYFDEWEDSGNARIVHRDGCWKLLDIKTGKEVWDTLFDCLENCSVYLVGNIYENPELMEG
ncbi:YopX family protein [Streptococcus suis]